MNKIVLSDISFDREAQSGPLTEIIYSEMYRRISSGDWPTDTLLPKEDELASAFRVSRTVVREALARLRYDGLIESKRGSGSRITRKPKKTIFETAHPHSISDLQNCYDFRIGVEPQAAYFAAQRRNDEALRRIELAQERLSACIKSDRLGAEEDIEFHSAIATATENDYYVKTIAAIAKPVEVGLTVAKALSNAPASERFAPTLMEHARILEAIRLGNAEDARRFMHDHIEASRQRVFVGII
jgi:DNA-binding FadR family transcriptional regulator